MAKSKSLENITISNLEKIVINFATPIEFIFESMFGNIFNRNPKFYGYLKQYGMWGAYWHSKIESYKRLIRAAEDCRDGRKAQKALGFYEQTPCGEVMLLTYRIVRK